MVMEMEMYLFEQLQIFSNVDKLKIVIKTKDMNTATGTPGVENNSVWSRGIAIRWDLTVTKVGQGSWIVDRHDEEDEADEEKRDRNYQQHAFVAADLVAKGLVRVTETWSLQHFVDVEFEILLFRWRCRLTL